MSPVGVRGCLTTSFGLGSGRGCDGHSKRGTGADSDGRRAGPGTINEVPREPSVVRCRLGFGGFPDFGLIGDGREGSPSRCVLPKMAFFVTPKRRAISAVGTSACHISLSWVTMSADHSILVLSGGASGGVRPRQ